MRKEMSPEEILKKKAASKSGWGGFWYDKKFRILRDAHDLKASYLIISPNV